jgi:DNA-binding response OmpR family regulator
MAKILIVEDEVTILRGLVDNFKNAGYEVVTLTSGEEALNVVKSEAPNLVILDVMLPGINGFEVCKRLREYNKEIPIIMLTARVEEKNKVYGLDIGADDYVTKPFSVQELLSRVKAIFRRIGNRKMVGIESFQFDDVNIDFRHYKAKKGDNEISLTRHEFNIMRLFAAQPNELLSRDDILEQALGHQKDVTTRTVDTHIHNLRKKLEDNPAQPRHFLTAHGAGYKFVL